MVGRLAKLRTPLTKSGKKSDRGPKLSEAARHIVLPSRIVSTGWPAVRDTCRNMGIVFDQWQDGAGRAILCKDKDGIYLTTTGGVVLSIPRQVGKTFLIGWIVFALCIVFPGLTVIWTAHRLRTADETFESMKSMASKPELKAHVLKVLSGAGDQEIKFVNTSRILFGARERGFGRGFTGVDIVVFDEAQILTERAIDDMLPAQNASPNALTFFIGTPPKPEDPSEVFTAKRADALSGVANDLVYIEFSADPDADLDDREQWRKANPSYPHRTNEKAMLRQRKNLSEESFRREAMGVWDDDGKDSAIPVPKWRARAISEVPESWPLAAVGLDMNPERTKVTIAVAAWSPDGVHVELAEDAPFAESGTQALVDWLWARCKRRVPVVLDAYSPVRSIEPELRKRGMTVRVLTGAELSQACGGFFDAVVKDKTLTHFGQEPLDMSLAGAVKQKFGDGGAWKWNRKSLDVDLTPTLAATCAHFGAVKFGKRVSVTRERKKVVIL